MMTYGKTGVRTFRQVPFGVARWRRPVMFERTTSLLRRLVSGQADDASPEGAGATAAERRVCVRHPCDLQTQYGASDGDDSLAARIVDISRGGVKVVVNRSHAPGSLISIELPGPGGETTFAALACVA